MMMAVSSSWTVVSPDRQQEDPVPYRPNGFEALKAYIESFPFDSGVEWVDENRIELGLHWDFCPCRHILRYASILDDVTTTHFRVNPRSVWEDSKQSSVNVTIQRGTDQSPTPVSFTTLRDRLKTYHPLRPYGTADELDRTCDTVADIVSYAIYHEFSIPATRVNGRVYQADLDKPVEAHAFNVIPPKFVTDMDDPVIVDGSAKQYADEGAITFPVFGPQDTIPLMQILRPSDELYEYYQFEAA